MTDDSNAPTDAERLRMLGELLHGAATATTGQTVSLTFLRAAAIDFSQSLDRAADTIENI